VREIMTHLLSIDLEEWFHANLLDDIIDKSAKQEVRVVENTIKLLDLLEARKATATFFVVGFVAETQKDLILEIKKRGHEIASHGYAHQLVYKQTEAEFKHDVERSKDILETIISGKIAGYRAPSWSITKQSLWALNILDDLGFLYDSSIFPVSNFLYGIPDAPREPHKPVEGLDLVEIPPSTTKLLGKNFGYSGGFYFRALPVTMVKHFIKKNAKNEKTPSLVYLHPRDIDTKEPKVKLKPVDHIIHYLNIKSCYKKFDKIISSFEFTSMIDYYERILTPEETDYVANT